MAARRSKASRSAAAKLGWERRRRGGRKTTGRKRVRARRDASGRCHRANGKFKRCPTRKGTKRSNRRAGSRAVARRRRGGKACVGSRGCYARVRGARWPKGHKRAGQLRKRR